MLPPIFCCLWLLSLAVAQVPPTAPAEPSLTTAVSRGGGLAATDDGRPLGIGSDYKVEFGPEGPVFTPALGERAPRDQTLAFRMDGYGRGGPTQPLPPAPPVTAGSTDTVTYDRGAVVERYRVQADGLKQDFVFAALPPGEGDLVVRGQVTTELVAACHADGLEFLCAGAGGVRIGGVVGIDANGDRATGSIGWHDGTIEYRLPAAFVANAALPLVLDPLLSSLVTLGAANNDDAPGLAYCTNGASWLVVWRRIYSAANSDVMGQRISASGGLIGPTLGLESNTSTVVGNPRVGTVRGTSSFLVAYATGGDVFVRTVSAVAVSIGTEVAIATGSNNQTSPEVGSDTVAGTGAGAIVVWRDQTADIIYVRTVAITGGNPILGTTQVVASNTGDNFATVSRSGGERGVWMIVWQRLTSVGTGGVDVWGRPWSRTGFLAPAQVLVNESVTLGSPAIDGDGHDFVLAYERVTTQSIDVVARPLTVRAGSVVVGTAAAVADTSLDEAGPSVAWLGQSVLVAWQQALDPSNHDAYVRSIDPYTCWGCEGTAGVGVTSEWQGSVEVSSELAGGEPNGGGGAMVWRSLWSASSTSDVRFARYDDLDGIVVREATPCGTNGEAAASCARRGNAAFQLRLRHGTNYSPAVVLVGFDRADWDCGPCVLVPEPLTAFLSMRFPEPDGTHSLFIPLPLNVASLPIYVQWGTTSATTAGCFGFDLSSAIRLTIQ